MPNPFVHVELHTTDIDTAKKFYSRFSIGSSKTYPCPAETTR
jgi:predicted enzyme related to lactoylglutathione lyase